MESIASNSPSSGTGAITDQYPPAARHRTAERITKALRHRLRLLHRSGPIFHVLGATANVYTVTLTESPSCSCPDRAAPCKHILFVLLRVLRLPVSHPSLCRRSLRPCLLSRLLRSPTAPDSLAGKRARERFRQLFFESADEIREFSGPCPVCLEEMEVRAGVVTCGTCGNSLHGECLERWRRSCRAARRAANCVICRARWRRESEKYLNLAAYVSEEDGGAGNGGSATIGSSCVASPG